MRDAPGSRRTRRARSLPRRGFTLVELLVVISVTALIGVTGGMLLAMLLTTETHSAEGLLAQSSFARLTRDLRRDAHAGISAEPPTLADGTAMLRIDLGNQRSVQYACESGRVVREESQAGEAVSHESYVLPGATCEAAFDAESGIVSIVAERPLDTHSETGVVDVATLPVRRWQADALLGWDRRYDNDSEATSAGGPTN